MPFGFLEKYAYSQDRRLLLRGAAKSNSNDEVKSDENEKKAQINPFFKSDLVEGSEEHAYYSMLHIENEIQQLYKTLNVNTSGFNCPGKHGLTQFETPNNTYLCDMCGESQAVGAPMYGCRICNWDACQKCHDSNEDNSITYSKLEQLKGEFFDWIKTIRKGDKAKKKNHDWSNLLFSDRINRLMERHFLRELPKLDERDQCLKAVKILDRYCSPSYYHSKPVWFLLFCFVFVLFSTF